jgi:hypothetical protein
MKKKMLNRKQFCDIVDETILINAFNLGEYQDKYYFQKKLKELVPELSEKEIYSTIDKYFSKDQESSKTQVKHLCEELYQIYQTKAK